MNIDNRLNLPFPFLDALEKQAFRQAKCNGNLKTFQILTDARRFPPFEMRVTACTGAVCDWELYDIQDNLIADLDAEYNICDYFDYDIVGGELIIQYDGDPFCTDLPTGQYYIKANLGDGGLDPDYECGTFYSEVVTICKNPTLITGWHNGGGALGFDTFSSDGEEIISAIEIAPAGVAYCFSDPVPNIENGNIITAVFCFLQNSGTRPVFSFVNDDGGGVLTSPVNYTPVDGINIVQFTVIRTPNPAFASYLQFVVNPAALTNFLVNDVLFYRDDDLFPLQDNMIIEYTNSCDLDNIYYDGLWRGPKIVFQPKIDITKPEYEITKDALPRDGYLLIKKTTTKKKYKFTFYAPEFMADAMNLLPSHDTITITDKFGDTATIKEINVNITPSSHCYFKIDVEMYIDPANVANCCA